MYKTKIFLLLLPFVFISYCFSQNLHSINFAANSWTEDSTDLKKWSSTSTVIKTYFKAEKTGKISISLIAKVQEGESKITFTMNKKSLSVKLDNSVMDTIYIGDFEIKQKGYQEVTIRGNSRTAKYFADIETLLVSGEAATDKLFYIKNDVYWGRRGPSVHLNYLIPKETEDIIWFYSEMEIPKGNDVVGSYFMANGFREGYFGIQVNSKEERRILFSIWSPYNTDNPDEIPLDQRITLLRRGEGVRTGKFGNEGSGGQSYKKYMWTSDTTYRFLLKATPVENNSTDYTAYFFAPEIGEWQLIASFRRPKTSTYLTHLHSFLENFIPGQGNIVRKVYYKNQWVCNKKGEWFELTRATFTADNTARKNARMDYYGGVEGEEKYFYLKNCGFFDETKKIGTNLARRASDKRPQIDFGKLP